MNRKSPNLQFYCPTCQVFVTTDRYNGFETDGERYWHYMGARKDYEKHFILKVEPGASIPGPLKECAK